MKKIITIDVKGRKAEAATVKCDVLAVGIFDGGKLSGAAAQVNKKIGGAIAQMIKLGDFKGKESQSAVVYGGGKIGATRVLLVGFGKKKELKIDTYRDAAGLAAAKAVGLKAKSLAIAFELDAMKKTDAETIGKALTEGAYFGGYRYDEYMSDGENGRAPSIKIEIVEPNAGELGKVSKGIGRGKVLGQAQAFARTIANRPGNVINPPSLAAEAKRLARGTAGLSCTVFDEKQLKAKKMGGILAVGAGSKTAPRLIVLKYTPKSSAGKKVPVIGLVGKAVTFDSGGISIKPSSGMQDMKLDKSGGIAVLGAMKAIAELKPSVKVFGIIPSAENMPGGSSYRPGDIVTTYSGKTVEIQNTDAEGRMILCDGLHYATEQKCDRIIDIATLTGACMVALGKYKAGLMGNDDKLIEALKKASEVSGEAVWHLPSGGEYLEEMKSKIADLKNIGSRWGGASTAGSFLSQFIGDKKWAHVDMAGVDMFDGGKNSLAPGASGFGVRLLTEYVLAAARK
jgi:leucyl aminopeptidase